MGRRSRAHRSMPFWLFVFIVGSMALHAASRLADADEGMWLFNRLPNAYLRKKYGFEIDRAWAEHVMKASLRFSTGGSGSFVSPTGLVLTNHHVAAEILHELSTPERNLYENGFLARSRDEELRAPNLELLQLVSIEDVTDRVQAAVKPGMKPAEAARARQAAIAAIEAESTKKTGLFSQVVTLYRGKEYHLYRYRRFTDVRLVFAPEANAAFFGGDPDNFEYPRYCLDMTLLRVYVDGKPYRPEHYLKWSPRAPHEGELVFVSGNPGRTSRQLTLDALKVLRDHRFPYTLNLLRRWEILLQQFSLEGEEQARRARDDLFGIQNARKAYTGMLMGLQDPTILARKAAEEAALRREIGSRPELKDALHAWETIRKAQKTYVDILVDYALLERGFAFRSQLFRYARTLVRLAEEDQKPNTERLREYQDALRPRLLQQLYSPAPIYKDLEVVKLADGLSLLAETYGYDDEFVQKVLQGKSPRQRAAELVDGTRLYAVRERKRLAEGGIEAIRSSTDPMIQLALLVDPRARKVRKRYEEEVEEPEREAYARIADARFAIRGTSEYPDATFTLRLAFGVVAGYQEDGRRLPPWTTFRGAFEHEARHRRKEPWVLPESWHRARSKLNLDTPLNFVATPDIIGGNSGSPVVNRDAQLVGLIFDSNIYGLTADYIYSEKRARAISVHAHGIIEALRKIYAADHLVRELLAE